MSAIVHSSIEEHASTVGSNTYTLPYTPAPGNTVYAVVQSPAATSSPQGWSIIGQQIRGFCDYLFIKKVGGGSITFNKAIARPTWISTIEVDVTNYTEQIAVGPFDPSSSGTDNISQAVSYILWRVQEETGNKPLTATYTTTPTGTEIFDQKFYSPTDGLWPVVQCPKR